MTAMQNAKSTLGTALITVEALLTLFVGTSLALFTAIWLFSSRFSRFPPPAAKSRRCSFPPARAQSAAGRSPPCPAR